MYLFTEEFEQSPTDIEYCKYEMLTTRYIYTYT